VGSTSALATWRASRSIELMAEGKTYDQIARAVGYANRGTAHRVVAKALSERLTEDVEQLRAVEGARLDALQAGLWEQAVAGDRHAARIVVRIIDQRSRLFGLYDVPPVWSPKALVMSRDEAMAYELGRRDGRAEAEAATRNAQQATQGRQRDQVTASA
jgi:hypothetical protein